MIRLSESVRAISQSGNRRRDIFGLVAWLTLSLGISAIGGTITRTSVSDWYPGLAKPWFTPSDWTFSIVWIVLFLLMGVSAWLVWRRIGFARGAVPLTWFAAQLALNLTWSILFFGLRAIGWALVEIVVFWAAVLMTAVGFYRVSLLAGLLLAPYLLWLSFAIALNASIWVLNTT
jgi:tryptophan-rich sensory protein